VIFSRGRREGRHAKAGDARRSGPRHARDDYDEYADDEYADHEYVDDEYAEGGATMVGYGPYDVAEVPADESKLDLGSLRIPVVEGVEVRVQASPEGVVQQVVLVHGDSALQLAAFAAPRSEGIWDEVRAEIRQSLRADGVNAEEVAGEYGPELRARVRTPDGPTDLRFLGVDGPRWMVRGVYQGAAAVDPDVAGLLADCLHGLVVDRGQEAKPVREALPLRLPHELAEQAGAAASPPGGAASVPGAAPAPGPDRAAADRVNGAAPPRTGGGGRTRRKPSRGQRRTS
jgi:Protein of unknown function (DUF3710)